MSSTIRVDKLASSTTAYRMPAYFYGSAREGFRDLLTSTVTTEEPTVLLPAYIGWSPREGSGILDPVIEAGAHARFYRLHEDLSVDVNDLHRLMQQHPGSVALVVHYFGRSTTSLHEVEMLARQCDVTIVEDLAHALFTEVCGGTAGQVGAASLYALHKMLPVSDGGLVRYRDASLIAGQQESRSDLRGILESFDLLAIGVARRDRFLRTRDALAKSPLLGEGFSLMWEVLEDGDVPQTLPIRVRTGARDQIYAEMNSSGFGLVSLYHTLVEPLRSFQPEMNTLASEITNFPVHQDVSIEMIQPMVDEFSRILAKKAA